MIASDAHDMQFFPLIIPSLLVLAIARESKIEIENNKPARNQITLLGK